MRNKIIPIWLLFGITCFTNYQIYSQCAMCKAVIEGGNKTMAEGVNNGIMYLMVFPYILVGILLYFIYRYRKPKKIKN